MTSYTDRSGSITTGGQSQILAAANPSRQRLFIENSATPAGQGIAQTETLFVNFILPAGVNNGTSIELGPGQSLDTNAGPTSTDQVNVTAATAGHRYIAKEI